MAMDKSQRLKLLFQHNTSLLDSNLGLRDTLGKPDFTAGNENQAPSMDKLNIVDDNPLAALRMDKQKPLTVSGRPEGSHPTELIVDSGTCPDKESSSQFECAAFETGVDVPSSLIAQSFCPLSAIAKLPYKYFRGQKSKAIARTFFDQGIFWDRTWDLYYIDPPHDISPRPLLLLPAAQVQQLLQEINAVFNTRLTLPTDPDLGLLLPFKDDGTPQPQFLGQCSSREMKSDLESSIPQVLTELRDQNEHAQDAHGSFEEFRQKIEAGVEATKKKAKSATKRLEKIERQREWAHSLKRTQCYLGLHPRRSLPSSPEQDEYESQKPTLEGQGGKSLAWTTMSRSVEVDKPTPFPFADEPIFICIDIEADERQHDDVTEIGISTLDTLDLLGVAPGLDGKNWISWIRSRHLRIKERAHIVNHQYVSGCPDRFDFGKSEWVRLKDASKMVEGCFSPPFSAHVPVMITEKQPDGDDKTVTINDTIPEHKHRHRNIVLVGHSVQSDIQYLRTLGCNFFSINGTAYQARLSSLPSRNRQPNFLEALDTANLFQVLKRDRQPRSLNALLDDLDIVSWNLHNGGNDARYTLEAMIRIALRSRQAMNGDTQHTEVGSNNWALGSAASGGSKDEIGIHMDDHFTAHEKAWKTEVERRVSVNITETELRVRDECRTWEIATGWDKDHEPHDDDIDGGKPGGIKVGRAPKKFGQSHK